MRRTNLEHLKRKATDKTYEQDINDGSTSNHHLILCDEDGVENDSLPVKKAARKVGPSGPD
jgi:hypothetical protein